MKTSQLRKIIKEEISNVLFENEDSPKDRSPKEVALFIKDKIKPYMDEDDVIHFIMQAIASWAKRQQKLGFYKNAKINTMVFNITQYNEDYIPDVFDELQKLGVKYDRLGSMRKRNPSQYEKLAKDSPEFIKKYSENRNINKSGLRENEIDYTDRNSGLLDAAKKLKMIQIRLDGFDILNAAQKALQSNKNTRLGPVSADWDDAAAKIWDFIKFLNKYDKV